MSTTATSATDASAAASSAASTANPGSGNPSSSSNKQGSKDFELPPTMLAKIIRAKLPEGYAMSKEAKQAFSKATGLFILYVTSCANDFCREKKKQTISAENVLQALEELEFGDLVPELKEHLVHIRAELEKNKEAAKAAKASSSQESATETQGDAKNANSSTSESAAEGSSSDNGKSSGNGSKMDVDKSENESSNIERQGSASSTNKTEGEESKKMEVEEEKTEYAAL